MQNTTANPSSSSTQGYPQFFESEKAAEVLKGKNDRGQSIEEATPVPVLTAPGADKVDNRKKATLRERMACPFSTAGNLFVKTVFKTGKVVGALAGIPAFLVGGFVGAAVSAPVAAVVKLVEMIARSNTSHGKTVFIASTCLGAFIGLKPASFIGDAVGKLVGTGLGIVSGLVGFGKGVRDAATGDVHRLEREKSTLKDFFQQAKQVEEEARKSVKDYYAGGRNTGQTETAASPQVVSLTPPETELYDDQEKAVYNGLRLDFLEGEQASEIT